MSTGHQEGTTTMSLNHEQVSQLLRPVHGSRVHKLDGMSHMEAYDIRAHLNRIFGFGHWSADVIEMTLMYEEKTTTKAGKPAFAVGYRAGLTLTVCGPDGGRLASYTEYAASGQIMPDFKRGDAHDFAMKTAESQALKRAAMNLGDQFGLSLYNNGSLLPLVIKTLVMPEAAPAEEGVDDGAPAVAPQPTEAEAAEAEDEPEPPKTVTRQRRPQPEPAAGEGAKRNYLAEIEDAGGDKDFLRILWKAAKADGEPDEVLNAIADAAA